jgi:hypothetical protein
MATVALAMLVALRGLVACGSDATTVDASGGGGAATGSDASTAQNVASSSGASGSGVVEGSSGQGGAAASVSGAGGAGGGVGGAAGIVPAIDACPKPSDACAAAPTDTVLRATYRKDVYLPQYAEAGTTEPTTGGRFHVAGLAAASGDVTEIKINGMTTADALAKGKLDWFQIWPRKVVAGEPLWVAFHSRDAAWDAASTGKLEVTTQGGKAIDGTFPVAKALVPLTYVTTTSDRATTVIHARNLDKAPHTLTSLFVDGRDVLASGAVCVPNLTVAPGEAVMWTVPRCAPLEPGSAWTVTAVFDGASTSVGVGRVLPPRFPIEAWTKSADCAFPGENDTSFQRHVDAGFDANFVRAKFNNGCNMSGAKMVNTGLTGTGYQGLITDVLGLPNPATALTNLDNVLGLFTGDEVDGELVEGGQSKPELQAIESRTLWEHYPTRPTYQGGKTNRHIGIFAGATDIQGMDFYVAACAPHITPFGNHPPLRAAFDYLRNTRNNHMPLPTWLYAQGLSDVWNKSTFGLVHVQPDPQEIDVQAISVIAAGGKGLMWFQTELAEADHAPKRWQAIARANRTFRAVREELRVGDVTGRAKAKGQAIVEAVRGREAIVVPVINLAVQTAPTDIGCAGAFLNEAVVPHWILKAQKLDVAVDVPADFGVDDVFEVVDGTIVDVPSGMLSVAGRTVTLGAVTVDNAKPTRVFVLAANPSVRTAMAAAGKP